MLHLYETLQVVLSRSEDLLRFDCICQIIFVIYSQFELNHILARHLQKHIDKNMLSSTVKRYMRDQVKIYFGLLKIRVKFSINLKLEISMQLVCLLMIACSLYYFTS